MSTSSSDMKRPVLALRDLVVFPSLTVPLLIGRNFSVGALHAAESYEGEVVLVTHKITDSEEVSFESVYSVGVIGKIIQKMQLEDGTYKVLVEAKNRVRIKTLSQTTYDNADKIYKFTSADYDYFPSEADLSENLTNVYSGVIKKLFMSMTTLSKVPEETIKSIKLETSLPRLAIKVISYLPVSLEKKQAFLEESSLSQMMKNLVTLLTYEVDALETQNRIQTTVQKQMGKNQREYYLNEQIKAIHKELDDLNDSGLSELDQLKENIIKAKMPQAIEEKALAEVKRLKSMPAMSSEGTVSRTYIDWLLKMPWQKRSRLKYDLIKAQERLDRDHAGLDKVKERIVEHLAVISHTRSTKGNILCLIGPPGVGKTTLARSVAEATGREFVRMSLGGVHDESEIRGHRRTYIGALPGKIVQLISKAGRKNPLILLDEIDKMGSDHRGDPAHALLEVLDPEQNHSFNDHYLDVDIDLSEVMFIATGNSFNIPAPLRDRMEIISLSSYTEIEKLEIAKNYLLPKQLKEHKLKSDAIKISDALMLDIIRLYTKEAGVRSLDRELAKICRKVITQNLIDHKTTKKAGKTDKKKALTLTPKILTTFLGVEKYHYGIKEKKDEVGFVNGLAWTQMGGELLGIEVELMPGKGNLISTGSLGEVMKESVRAAMTVIRARASSFGLPHDFNEKWDIHVHAPEGAVPKDGPSAGAAITLAILSALLNIPIKSDIGMTGEVTLRGKILAIGGLKEKLLAAARGGLKTVLIPKENEKDLEDIPVEITRQLSIFPVIHINEVIDYGFAYPIENTTTIERYSGFYDYQPLVIGEKNNQETH